MISFSADELSFAISSPYYQNSLDCVDPFKRKSNIGQVGACEPLPRLCQLWRKLHIPWSIKTQSEWSIFARNDTVSFSVSSKLAIVKTFFHNYCTKDNTTDLRLHQKQFYKNNQHWCKVLHWWLKLQKINIDF